MVEIRPLCAINFQVFFYKLCFIQSRFRHVKHFSFVKDFIKVAKKMSSFVSFEWIQTTFTGEKCTDLRNITKDKCSKATKL